MKKLHELLRVDRKAGIFGIEIECEGNNLVPVINAVWNTVDDGSLRGVFPVSRCEWVMQAPLPLNATIDAVKLLAKENERAQLNFSFRTSLHVHMNVQELTFDQYLALIYTYLLLEEPLMRFCGQQRLGNRFCLRIRDAEAFLDTLEHMSEMGEAFLRHIMEDQIRYASVNIAATKKYGSLEFRGMRGTLDVNVISTWLTALNRLREFAIKTGDPMAVHDVFVKNNVAEFAKEVLGDVAEAFYYEDVNNDIRHSFSLTLNIPYKHAARKRQEQLLEARVKPKKAADVWKEDGPFQGMNVNVAVMDELANEVGHQIPAPRVVRVNLGAAAREWFAEVPPGFAPVNNPEPRF